mmetsp:Transcript_81/g.104  ORF Transcript_81/g.104 Transcript_81/m.104 type:complete len:280 (+) Transcript_81:47-886(+)
MIMMNSTLSLRRLFVLLLSVSSSLLIMTITTTGVVQVVDARRLGVGIGGVGGGEENNQKLVRIVGGIRPHHYSSSSRENNKIEEMEITLQKYRAYDSSSTNNESGSKIIESDELQEAEPEAEIEPEPERKEENNNKDQSHHNRHRSLSFSLLWANTFIDTVRQEIESTIENTHLLSVMPLRRSLGGGRVLGVMESSSSSSSASLRSSSASSSSSQSLLHGSNSNRSTNRQSSTHRSLYQAWARDTNGKILWWIWFIIALCLTGCCCVSCCFLSACCLKD